LNRQEPAISVIKLERRLVADTPLQRLPARDVTVAPDVIGDQGR
jgi:hypothetical protein